MSEERRREPTRAIQFRSNLPSYEEMPTRREALIANAANAIYQAVEQIPDNMQIEPFGVSERRQVTGDSCWMACNVSIRDGILQTFPELPIPRTDERQLVDMARRENAMGSWGTSTVGTSYHRAEEFIRRNMGLQLQQLNLGIKEEEVPMIVERLVEHLTQGEVAILAYNLGPQHEGSGHFVVINGFSKLAQRDLRWRIMDPLSGFQNINTDELLDKLINRMFIPEHHREHSTIEGRLYAVSPVVKPRNLWQIAKSIPPQTATNTSLETADQKNPTGTRTGLRPLHEVSQPNIPAPPIGKRTKLKPLERTAASNTKEQFIGSRTGLKPIARQSK